MEGRYYEGRCVILSLRGLMSMADSQYRGKGRLFLLLVLKRPARLDKVQKKGRKKKRGKGVCSADGEGGKLILIIQSGTSKRYILRRA